MKSIPPVVLLILATILWGGNFVIGRAVAQDLSPYTLAFLRWCTALLFFFPIAWSSLKQDWHKIRSNWPIVIIMAFTGVASFNTLVYVALHYTTSINASLVNTSTPIIIYILSFLFLKEKLTMNQILGTIISLVGVTFIISNGSIENLLGFTFNTGDLIIIIAVICWSIYSLLLKQYAVKLPGKSTFLISIIIGTLMLLPFFIYEISNPEFVVIWSTTSIFAIFYTGIFASIIAFLAWNSGVVQLGANRAGIFLNFIPVFATVFAVLFIGEALQWFQVVGGAFVISGIFLSTRSPLSKTN